MCARIQSDDETNSGDHSTKGVRKLRGLQSKWKRQRVTTNLAGENVSALQGLSDNTGVSMGRLLDQALDEFFLSIGLETERAIAPIDVEALRKIVRSTESDTDKTDADKAE